MRILAQATSVLARFSALAALLWSACAYWPALAPLFTKSLAALGILSIALSVLAAPLDKPPNPLWALPFLISTALAAVFTLASMAPPGLLLFGVAFLLAFWAQLQFIFRS